MVCQSCNQNPATIHVTNIDDDEERIELNYCEECAAAQGIASEVSMGVNFAAVVAAAARGTESDLSCPHCGLKFSEFRRKGRLGCPMDYEVFRAPLEGVLRSEHDNHVRHRGRLPSGRLGSQGVVNERLLYLRKQLQDAVRKEDYEEAARFRDEIHEIERGSGEPNVEGLGIDAPWGEA